MLRIAAFMFLLVLPGFAQTASAFSWTRVYAGKRTESLARDPLFQGTIELVVPNLQIHMGRDLSLPADLTTQFRASRDRVRLADGRYLTFSGYRPDGGVSHSFIWIDLAQGHLAGAVFVRFDPLALSERLILFSNLAIRPRQTSDLPPAFVAALADWQHAARLPQVLPLFFARSRPDQYALRHSPDNCSALAGVKAASRCAAANQLAAALDVQALAQEPQGPPPLPPIAAPATPADAPAGSGFRDPDAGIEFFAPSDWTSQSRPDGMVLQPPDRTLIVLVRTLSGSEAGAAPISIGALACAHAVVPCRQTTNPRSLTLHGLPATTADGELDAPRVTAVWRAFVIQAKLPVLLVFHGSARGLAAHAADLAALRASIAPLP